MGSSHVGVGVAMSASQIASFNEVTGNKDRSVAVRLLSQAGGDVEAAVGAFFAGGGDDDAGGDAALARALAAEDATASGAGTGAGGASARAGKLWLLCTAGSGGGSCAAQVHGRRSVAVHLLSP